MATVRESFDKEPAVLIGIVGTVVITAITQLVSGGLITADHGQSAVNVITDLGPLVLSLITRQFVFSPTTVDRLIVAATPEGADVPVDPAK